jgi:hypothetical protein
MASEGLAFRLGLERSLNGMMRLAVRCGRAPHETSHMGIPISDTEAELLRAYPYRARIGRVANSAQPVTPRNDLQT